MSKNLKNDIAHITTGLIVSAAALIFFRMEYAGIIMAAITGFSVESYQLIGKREPWWVLDRLRDLTGYILGGSIMAFIFVCLRWV